MSFFKNLERALNPVQALQTVVGIAQGVAQGKPAVALQAVAAGYGVSLPGSQRPQPQPGVAAYPGAEYTTYPLYYTPPPAYSVYFQEPRGEPWEFSTSSQIPYSTQLVTSEAISSNRRGRTSWEDFLQDSLQAFR